jgi:hypothetical protein
VPVLLRYAVEEDPVPIDKREIQVEQLADEQQVVSLGQQAEQAPARVADSARQMHRKTMRSVDAELADDVPPASGPFVRAVLRPEEIRRLVRDERLAFIGLDGEKDIPDYPTIPESLPTTRTQTVHSTGVRGTGVRIAVLESGCPNVNVACFNIGATQDLRQPANDHMTKSIGIIGNRYSAGSCGGSWQGYAPDATVLLANESAYQDRYDWARGQGVNVVTMSWHFGSEETSGSLHRRHLLRLLGNALAVPECVHVRGERGRRRVRLRQRLQLHGRRECAQRSRRRSLRRRHLVDEFVEEPDQHARRPRSTGGRRPGSRH